MIVIGLEVGIGYTCVLHDVYFKFIWAVVHIHGGLREAKSAVLETVLLIRKLMSNFVVVV